MEGGGTLQEWGGRRTVMDAFPAMDCYEDMFKEITRKLYGEDGLPDMAESDHSSSLRTTSDYDGEGPDGGHGALAAFGLAALMQNGFPPPPGMFGHHHHLQTESIKYRPTGEDKWVSSEETLQWTSSKIATYNSAQKLFRCTECECVGFLSRVAEHWLGTHANLRVFQCPQCPYASAWARCVRMHLQRQHNVVDTAENSTDLWKENPVLEEVTKYLQRLKTKVEFSSGQNMTNSSSHSNVKTEFVSNGQNQGPTQNASSRSGAQAGGSENTPNKRYCCTFCPYATDRRDLFTRHENIHRDEKPFQCYVCQKQFNRADHVKKHFLRMHRDHPYDLNRIRKQPPKNSNGMSYYQKYNSGQQNPARGQVLPAQGQMSHGLNIPAGFPPPPTVRGVKPPLPSPPKLQQNGCNAKSQGGKSAKKKGEKRYSCCYCAWSGVDNWCLKRHLNTHLKPFVCGLCDYKAARSERLATHVLKVHNKRACGRCSFLGEDSAQLAIHMQEHHPLEHRNRSSNNVLRNTNFTNNHGSSTLNSSFCSHDSVSSSSTQSSRRHFEESSTPGLWNPHGHVPSSYTLQDDGWKNTNKHFGAARLFHYMEASDNSEPENEHEEEEPPPFICRECGCEFVDDTSLETHVFMHHRSTGQRSTKQEPIRSLANKYIKCEQRVHLLDVQK
ncbi:hypothetical protein RUM43_004722 [Polyplax serrata]|uniref:C2H2-type domain-containing protein n=1 Tax=Polyplax serrata TaxID=468196 RepID=A0AAN8SB46_POLSC